MKKDSDARIPEAYRRRFEDERLSQNIGRMLGLSIYIIVMQIVLQVVNAAIPMQTGEGMQLPLFYYIALSLISMAVGAVWAVLLALARKGKIRSRAVKAFLVNCLLYAYVVITLFFHTFNILTRNGLNSYFILVLILGLLPILPPPQSVISIVAVFLYTIVAMNLASGIVDKEGISELQAFATTDIRSSFIIITFGAIFISVVVYRLFAQNFLKGMALEEANAGLEETVRQRTKALEEKTLAAETAAAVKSRFLASMSHEIRTPLNAIIGMARVAENADSKEKMLVYLDKIDGASIHLLGILNDILETSNIEFGQLKLDDEAFDPGRVVFETANSMRAKSDEKRIGFTLENGAENCGNVKGDRLKLQLVLTNLIGNAIRFTPVGGHVDFKVALSGGGRDSVSLAFTVSDDGIGISEEQKGRLFKAFEQGATGEMKNSGAGLGLAISQSIVRLMGSEIAVESEEGKGSVFSFAIALPRPTEEEAAAEMEIPDLSGKRVLIVEDIEINRVVLAEVLREVGAIVEEAEDGAVAVSMFEASPEGYYSFVFMDIMMPNMDGREATRRIRALDRTDALRVPIIAVSANAFEEDVVASIDSGMNEHLAKPVDFMNIMRAVAREMVR
ncbi:MAG: response regulator [Clostridiales Family XIII bacterium]|jgi:signal transduction histidine kinase/CheY-like chemotaxis protein|nr:response regulator [Clostridiales Family XIII bacterium]